MYVCPGVQQSKELGWKDSRGIDQTQSQIPTSSLLQCGFTPMHSRSPFLTFPVAPSRRLVSCVRMGMLSCPRDDGPYCFQPLSLANSWSLQRSGLGLFSSPGRFPQVLSSLALRQACRIGIRLMQ